MIADEPIILTDLRAAHAARAAEQAEVATWDGERERQRAAIAALEAQAETDRSETRRLRGEIQSALSDPAAEARNQRRRDLTERAARILVDLRARALPGTVPEGDPATALAAAVQAQRQVAIAVVQGRLADQVVAVRLLRVGIFRGWWLALDGRAAGIARMREGRLVLEPQASPAIREAFAQMDGHRTPAWLELPE